MLRRPTDITAIDFPIQPRTLGEFSEVEPLLTLCGRGKLYEVEQWIGEGRPIQYPPPDDPKLQRRSTALQLAVERGFHSLAALLLANGYDPNGDYYECTTPAVEAKDRDMVDLLFRFGADPNAVDFCAVLETCDRQLMDRFIEAGADPCRRNAVARALGSQRRPVLGFVRQYRERFPALQRQVDIALRVATEANKPRRIALMLWLGGNPHAIVPSSAYDDQDDDSSETAFEHAMWASDTPQVLAQFMKKPIPPDQVQELILRASFRANPDLVRRLLAEGADPNALSEEGYPVLYGFINSMLWRFGSRSPDEPKRALEALELILKAGAKWNLSERQLKSLRRDLAGGESGVVVPMMELLRKYGAFSAEQFHELTRTPAVKSVLKGITRPRRDPFGIYHHVAVSAPAPSEGQPPSRGYWKRHWSQR